MKKGYLNLTVMMLVFSLVFTSCDKDEDEDDPTTPPPTEQNDQIINIEGSDATLIAIKSKSVTETIIGPFVTEISTAVAVFYENGIADFIDAGEVTVNDNALSKQSNNSYVSIPDLSNPDGLDFSMGIDWNVGGSALVTAFSFTPSIAFPNAGEITSSDVVTRADGYTISVNSITAADSILYQIGGVYKIVPNNQLSHTFTAEDLADVDAGYNVVQAAGLKYQNEEINGKNVYFLNEMVVTKTVTVE